MKKFAAILIRVSTTFQKEHGTSLHQQKSDLLRLARAEGYTVLKQHIYDDGGYSGSQLTHGQRPGLSELIKAAEKKVFEVVFVQYIDRFGRTNIENLIVRDKLKKLAIVIHSQYEGRMTNDPAGDLLFMFHSWKAQADNDQRKEKTTLGRIAAAKRGKYCMGNPNYGYIKSKKSGKLTIDRKRAAWVQKFYHWLVHDRLGLREICRRANELGVPLPSKGGKHKVWHRSTLHGILTNPNYTGKVIFRRYDKAGNERPKEDWIELSIPPLISEELFAQAQKQLAINKEMSLRRTKRTYLFGKLLFCGYCGYRLGSGFQSSRKKGMVGSRYYHGILKREDLAGTHCLPCPQVGESRLQPVWEAIRNVILDPVYAQAKIKEYHSHSSTNTEECLAELEQRISSAEAKKTKILDLYLDGRDMSKEQYVARLNMIDSGLRRLRDEKRSAEQTLLNKRERLELARKVEKSYQKLQQQVAGASYETKREIMEKVVNKIIVYEREKEAEVILNLVLSGQKQSDSAASTDRIEGKERTAREFVSSRPATTGHKSDVSLTLPSVVAPKAEIAPSTVVIGVEILSSREAETRTKAAMRTTKLRQVAA